VFAQKRSLLFATFLLALLAAGLLLQSLTAAPVAQAQVVQTPTPLAPRTISISGVGQVVTVPDTPKCKA
jgi:uncharacterized protein YggE